MKPWPLILLLLGALSVSSVTGQNRKKAPSGLVQLSESMINLLHKIESRLETDQETVNQGWQAFLEGMALDIERGSLARHRLTRGRAARGLRTAWSNPNYREAVLLQLATVDLAIDELAAAQLEDLQALERERDRIYRELLALLKTIRVNQQELHLHLENRSAFRKLGEIDARAMASAVLAARQLVDRVRGELEASDRTDLEPERQRLQDSIEALQQLLDQLASMSQSGNAPPGGEK